MTSRAFDLALFVGVPVSVNDASVVSAAGPPFTTAFKSVALSNKPGGVVVGADVPAANAKDQILISGAGPTYAWALGTNPAAAASVPPPSARYDLLMADATPAWGVTSIGVVLDLGGAVTESGGGTFDPNANLVFSPSGSPTRRIDGGDPAFSILDGFTIDAGTF